MRDGAVPFQDEILFDGPDRAALLLGDHTLSLPAAILTYCLKKGAREITASDAALPGLLPEPGWTVPRYGRPPGYGPGQAVLNENASNAEK